ncbi:SDR family NAD(P)-dependent oxidoreductase [Inquilinus sp. CAU 1745]|uniref:SDR family NAD(P)-dependent oxidoreductase n=1 Tax=Inquilinus sp. CAU 1745 TaxID=3140369 RepID=UPI00325BF5A1
MTGFADYPSLRGRSVLITGGASGIGASMVAAFAAQGARVGFIDIDDGAAETVQQAAKGSRPAYRRADVTDIPALKEAIAELAAEIGAIDILINNAADDSSQATPSVTPDDWNARLAVNLNHHFFAAQAISPGMKAAGGGVILNVGSIIWRIGQAGRPAYATAKAAIVGLTRSLARELGGDNIRVNCLMPGAVLTEKQKAMWMTPEYEATVLGAQCLKRHIMPDEVARLALFLASDDSAGITSQNFIIDGGWV